MGLCISKYNNLFLDYLFHVYYISYTALGLYLLVLWYKKATYTREKIQAKIMIFTIILPFLIGTVNDIIIPLMQKVFLPPISAVLFNILITGIWYAMAKYKLMNLKVENLVAKSLEIIKEGMILLDTSKVIQDVNHGTLLILGYDESELVGKEVDWTKLL